MAERRGTKALELWCRRMTDGYPGVKIDNMTTSWRDGLAFCAMIHHFRPDLIEFEKLNKADVYYNNELAFTTAEKYLGIPALLDADDMATYEVPDRLSILTYLSQFYQVFAAQDSHNRLKRPSPAVEKAQIAKTPGPPPKMAHVVGVPRRDPCQKCKLPVFLAERLTVGKKVYHRTCLKCARCGYQLTPGSFYETEVDDEFCCETCPDEEELDTESPTADSSVQLRHDHQSASVESPVISPPRSRSVRSSIADRLAFFEQSKAVGGGVETASSVAGAKLLQKSLSDEEKTKSLQKIEASSTVTTPKTTPYKMNSAFSSFLNNTIDAGADVEEPDDTTSEATSSAAETPSVSLRSQNLRSISSHQMETSDSEDVDDLSLENRAPELPKSQPPPPSDAPREQPGAAPEDQNREQTRKFTSTAQLQLSSKWTADAPQDLPHEPQPQEPHDERSAGSGGDAEGKPLVEQTRTKKTEVQLNLFAGPTTDTVTTSAVIGAKDGNANIDSNSCNSDKENNKADDTILIPTTIQDDEIKYMDDDNEEDDDVDNSDDANDVQAKLEPRKPNDNNCVTKEETPENDAQQTRLEDPPSVAATDCAEVTTTLATTSVMEVETEEQKSPKLEAEASPVELRPKTTSNEDTEVTVSRDQNQLHHDHLHPGVEDVETTKRLSVVRARLHQFEVIANNVPDLDKDNANHNNRIGETNDSPSRSPIHKPDAEAESPTEHPTAATTIGEEVDDQKQETIEEITDNVKETDKSLNQVPTKEVVNEQHDGGDGEKVVEVEVDVVLKKDNNEHIDIKSVEMPMELGEERGGEQREDYKEEPINVDQPEETAPKVAAAVEKVTPATTPGKLQINEYPEDLNPFQSDDDDAEEEGGAQDVDANKENILRSHLSPTPRSLNVSSAHSSTPKTAEKSYKQSLNPFDSSDDEVELEKSGLSSATSTPSTKVPPPRPPPPRISRNPFGEENDDSNSSFSRRSSLSSSLTRKTPVPTPRSNVSQSQNPTPEPTPRLGNKSQPHLHQSQQSPALQNSSDYYGSANSLGSTPQHSGHGHGLGLGIGLYRNSDVRGSNNSLTSSAGGTIRSRKQRRAPAPPSHPPVKELFPSAVETATGTGNSTTTTTSSTTEGSSKASTPSSSTVGTPRQGRKKRPAPAPPKPARLDPALLPTIAVHDSPTTTTTSMTTQPKNLLSYPLQADLDSKLSDEEKALLEGNLLLRQQALHSSNNNNNNNTINEDDDSASRRSSRRVIPLDASLLEDEGGKCDDIKHREHEEEMNVVYRRILVPPMLETPTHDSNPLLDHLNESHDRQLEKLKDNKEAKNRNRQSQISASSGAEDSDPTLYNKSAHGKWKRRKGPAPALPIPPRKVLQMLPLQEIKHELEIIEVQQQGLEKQGVVLEKMIRDRCEGENGEPLASGPDDVTDGGKSGENSKEVEDLILQLFELVNEKNELFRRQAELMYLRRQHRLEQEQADLEYEIRVLMAQPERNKTDSDKAREEALIARLVDVVQLRNEVIECLEMDRLREAEEDMSIKRRLELHTAQREVDDGTKAPSVTKLSKKEKKKQKETKKLGKSKKLDADKDADESELNSDKQKAKKKKKKFIF